MAWLSAEKKNPSKIRANANAREKKTPPPIKHKNTPQKTPNKKNFALTRGKQKSFRAHARKKIIFFPGSAHMSQKRMNSRSAPALVFLFLCAAPVFFSPAWAKFSSAFFQPGRRKTLLAQKKNPGFCVGFCAARAAFWELIFHARLEQNGEFPPWSLNCTLQLRPSHVPALFFHDRWT